MRVGDRVKLILDKERSPDNRWHGKTGTITRITMDAAGDITGDPLDSLLFEVKLVSALWVGDQQPEIPPPEVSLFS